MKAGANLVRFHPCVDAPLPPNMHPLPYQIRLHNIYPAEKKFYPFCLLSKKCFTLCPVSHMILVNLPQSVSLLFKVRYLDRFHSRLPSIHHPQSRIAGQAKPSLVKPSWHHQGEVLGRSSFCHKPPVSTDPQAKRLTGTRMCFHLITTGGRSLLKFFSPPGSSHSELHAQPQPGTHPKTCQFYVSWEHWGSFLGALAAETARRASGTLGTRVACLVRSELAAGKANDVPAPLTL